jgi:hypothetical protein
MFLDQTKFQLQIEEIVVTNRLSYLDAVVYYCQKNELEPEEVTKLITSNLKDKIKVNAMDEGLIKREARLPI